MLGVVLEGYDMKVLTEIDSWNKTKEKVFNRLQTYKKKQLYLEAKFSI